MKIDDIKRIGVVGAGQMGSGIAQVAAASGWEVLLLDVTEAVLQTAMKKIREGFARAVEKRTLGPDQTIPALARLRTTGRLQDLAEVQLVIEAASEKSALKLDLFRQIGCLCKPETILASNTSSISITKLGAASGRPDRVVGIHFMNPAPVMKLVEVVRGVETSEETMALALGLVTR
ncbi:MAG: 3-hydroxybutyryl-CoA dehydrogenase, partial [Nitrospirae bacterium]